MGRFQDWKPYENWVQGGLVDGKWVSGMLTMVAAGPPRLSDIGGDTQLSAALDSTGADVVYPIGCVQNVNHSQNKTFMRIWELGSDRSYFIGGRTVGNLALSRVFYHGPSLLRVLYAYYQDSTGPVTVDYVFPNGAIENTANPHDVRVPPGYENFFLNLASDLFNQPIGLLLYVRDSALDIMGALYLESVVVPNHTWATDAQGTIVQETAALQYERVIPVQVDAVALVQGFEENLLSQAA